MKSIDLYFSLTFIFIQLSETTNSFVKIHLLLEIKNFASFLIARFYWKRGCIKMRKHAETFHTNKSCKLAIVVFIPTLPFSKHTFAIHSSNVFWTKMRTSTLVFITLSSIWHGLNGNVLRPWRPVFWTSPFSKGFFSLRSRVRVRVLVRVLDNAFPAKTLI